MKKFGMLVAGIAVAFAAQAARAQVVGTNDGLAIWYDTRNTVAAIETPPNPAAPAYNVYRNGTQWQVVTGKGGTILVLPHIVAGNTGGPGDGQTLWIDPRQPANPLFAPTVLGLHWTGSKTKAGVVAVDQSKKSIYKYATVRSRGGAGEVIGALGLDTVIDKGGAGNVGNLIESMTVTANGSLWNGNNNVVTGPDGNQDWRITAKAVKVPVSNSNGSPVYNAAGGAVPQTSPYQLGSINFVAGIWRKPTFGPAPTTHTIAESTYTLKDEVNNLLVTRVVSSGSLPPEEPDFGYLTPLTSGTGTTPPSTYTSGSPLTANLPEANSGLDGLTVGCTSTDVDATVIVQPKGDFDQSNTITSGDLPGFNGAITLNSARTIRQREVYLGDCDLSGTVTSGDLAFFNAIISGTSGASHCFNAPFCP